MIRPLLVAGALAFASPAFAEGMEGMPGMGSSDAPMPTNDGPVEMIGDEVPPQYNEGSGTSLLPLLGPGMSGIHVMNGDWMIMTHATFNLVYNWQDGPRGDDKTFVAGMFMTSAEGPVSERGTLKLQAMLSPYAFMGKDGYPLLLQTGETADGVTPLVDRQHPHDLFMELSATYRYNFGSAGTVFVYAGLPGEPAFGPTAFMHRPSIMDSPEAPISHHWLDSTHVTFGVVTLGWQVGRWQVEGSVFNGREPDENRYNIETGPLDAHALRVTWAPNANWVLQASWAEANDPEQLHPGEDQVKWSASVNYANAFLDGDWDLTAAWAARSRITWPSTPSCWKPRPGRTAPGRSMGALRRRRTTN